MKKTALSLALLLLSGLLVAQDSLAGLRRQLYEHGETLADRAELWGKFKARLYPLSEDMLKARLENNLTVLGVSMLLLLNRDSPQPDSLFWGDIAELAEANYRFAQSYLKTQEDTSPPLSPSLRPSYDARLPPDPPNGQNEPPLKSCGLFRPIRRSGETGRLNERPA